MTESEGPRPEHVDRRREEEPVDVRLTASEIYLVIGGLNYVEHAQRNRFQRVPSADEDPAYTRMDRDQAKKELDSVIALRQKLIALLQSREDVVPPDDLADE